MGKIETYSVDPHAFFQRAATPRPNPYAGTVARWRSVLRRISDATGDASFLVVRRGCKSLCVHREIGHYPVQVLVVSSGHRQPLGVGAAGLALLAALPEEDAQRVIERNEPALNHYGEITAAQMTELVKETRERGWASLGNTAVPGALGVGMAWYGADGLPKVGVSVASLVDRMPWHRQLWIAELLREQLAANTWPRRHRSIRKAF